MSIIDRKAPYNAGRRAQSSIPQVEGTGGFPPAAATPETADRRLLNEVSALRHRALDLNVGVKTLHQDVREIELDERTTAAAMRDPRELVRELSHRYGLSWATIARLARVSPTAVRKWRRGESMTPENRRGIARAVTFLEMLVENAGPLEDVGSWLEMPLSDSATLTPVDLYVANRIALLLDHAAGHMGAHAMLDAFEPDWRNRYGRDTAFQVVDAGDGDLSIIERPR